MKSFILLLSLFSIAATTLAGSYQVVYQEPIVGAQAFTYIDPILKTSLEGFVFTDSAGQRFVVHRFIADSAISVASDFAHQLTANISYDDSLVVYGLTRDDFAPRLERIVIASMVTCDTLWPRLYAYRGLFDRIYYENVSIEYSGAHAPGVRFEQCLREWTYWNTRGYEYWNRSVSNLYAMDFSVELSSHPYSIVRTGSLISGGLHDTAWYETTGNKWDFRDGPDSEDYGDNWGLTQGIHDYTGTEVVNASVSYGEAGNLFVGDFLPGTPGDEVIYYVNSMGLDWSLSPRQWHAACYSLASGSPEYVWLTPLSGVTLEHVYEPQHYIAGMRGTDEVIMLNYWSGALCDSVALDRNLSDTKFFETGDVPSVLNLVGRSHDTVFVYQFQTPTGINGQPNPVLPASFSLDQNYPNPFNNGTVVRFSNNQNQQLSLRIYNVIGQEVRTLLSETKCPGEFLIEWDGRNDAGRSVASGIYLAKLSSADQSELIKMILLK